MAMSCEQATTLLHLTHDGEPVEATDALGVRTHCASCDECRELAEELEKLSALLEGALSEPEPVPFELTARFASALKAEQARERYWQATAKTARTWTRIAATLALAASLAAGGLVWQMNRGTETDGQGMGETALVAATSTDDYLFGQQTPSAEVVAELALGSDVLNLEGQR